MTVEEAVKSTVCDEYSALIFKRIAPDKDGDTFGEWLKNRKLVRMVWASTPDDECPPIDEALANLEIEDNVAIVPVTMDYAFTLKA